MTLRMKHLPHKKVTANREKKKRKKGNKSIHKQTWSFKTISQAKIKFAYIHAEERTNVIVIPSKQNCQKL